MADSIKEIIVTWKESLGGFVPIKEARLQPMKDLFASFAHHGYSKDDCATNFTKSLVIAASVPYNSKGSKRDNWIKAVQTDIDIAIATQWPSELVRSESTKATDDAQGSANRVEQRQPRTRKQVDPDFLASMPKPDVEYDDEEFSQLLLGVK